MQNNFDTCLYTSDLPSDIILFWNEVTQLSFRLGTLVGVDRPPSLHHVPSTSLLSPSQ